MPFRKQDATRALELLEDYHRHLDSPHDVQLRSAIERVIKVFKSKLFSALLEIQEFYELTLLDDSKTIEQKTMETMEVADRWCSVPSLTALPIRMPSAARSLTRDYRSADSRIFRSFDQDLVYRAAVAAAAAVAGESADTDLDADADSCFSTELFSTPAEVLLERNEAGFGFSIAGGIDAPHLSPDDPLSI